MRKPLTVKKNTKFERTLLHDWMMQEGVSLNALSARLGVHKTSVQAWRVGSGLPSLPAAFRLEQVTKGKVPASSWLVTTVGRTMYEQMLRRANEGGV
jgi:predicted transcriptional regulator